jgi:3-hydroxyisobutyrate dehydrogenase-like beta-hydroxyacid dehydrogenase
MAAIGAQIANNGHTVLWCPDGRSPTTHRRAEDRVDLPARGGREGCRHSCESQISRYLCRGERDQPRVPAPISDRLTKAGATVFDGCFFGSPPGGQPPARLYLAGALTASRRVVELFVGSLVETAILGERLGRASALKMAFACFQRTSRIAAALAHALADDHGITDTLLTEAHRMPSDILTNRDFLPSVVVRAWRWVPEMHEVAGTLDAAHLPPDLALATAAVLHHWADNTKGLTDLGSIVRQLHLCHP